MDPPPPNGGQLDLFFLPLWRRTEGRHQSTYLLPCLMCLLLIRLIPEVRAGGWGGAKDTGLIGDPKGSRG